MSLSRNTLINLAGAMTPIVLTAITVPLYLQTIGGDRYGALVALWLVATYLGVFDFGMGKGVTKALSQIDSPLQRQQLIIFGLRLSLLTGMLGAAISVPAFNWYFERGIQATPELRAELRQAIAWAVACIPITATAVMCSGILESRQRFQATMAANVTGSVVAQVAPLVIALMFNCALQALIPFITLGRALGLVMLLRAVWISERPFQTKAHTRLDETSKREIYRFGGWNTVSNIVAPLLVSLDKFVLSTSSSLQTVARYNISFSLASVIALIPSSLANAVFPQLSSSKDHAEGLALTDQAMNALAVIITPIVIMGITWSPLILDAWLGHEFAAAAQWPAQLLMLGMWPHAFAYIPYARLHAQGNPRAVALCHAAQLPPYLLALSIVLPVHGMIGAAMLWSARATLDSALLFFAARAQMKLPRRLAWDAAWILAALVLTQLLVGQVPLAGTGLLLAAAYLATQRSAITAFFARG